jgi:hypothetical protein
MNNKIEKYWNEKNYIKFELELKKFIGYVCRKYFAGFKQSSEQYEDIKDKIVIVIYTKLFSNDFEKTRDRIKILKILKQYDKWKELEDIFNMEFKTLKILKKFLKGNWKSIVIYDEIILRLNVSDIKSINFTSYLYTTIRGEFTKFFNKFNRERKFLNIEDVSNTLKNRCEEQNKSNNYLSIIKDIINEQNLNDILNSEEVLEYILYPEKIPFQYDKINYIKLITWYFIKRQFNLTDMQDLYKIR